MLSTYTPEPKPKSKPWRAEYKNTLGRWRLLNRFEKWLDALHRTAQHEIDTGEEVRVIKD